MKLTRLGTMEPRSRLAPVVGPEGIRIGARVRVGGSHRIAELRGTAGTVVGRYGGDGCMALDVRFADGRERLFWPRDLEEVSSPRPPWWRSLIEKAGSR